MAKCKYGDTADEMVRDMIVIGLYNENIRRRLLGNAKLTLEKAIDALEVEEQVEREIPNVSALLKDGNS